MILPRYTDSPIRRAPAARAGSNLPRFKFHGHKNEHNDDGRGRRRTGPGSRGIGPPPHGTTLGGRHRCRGGRVAPVQQLRRLFLPGNAGERT